MKRGQPTRQWDDAIDKCRDEGECRICHVQRSIQCAHTVGRKYDQPKPGRKTLWVDPDSVIPLCAHCHDQQERGEVGILEVMTYDEQLYAVKTLGSIEAARRELDPQDYHRVIQGARMRVREATL